MYSNIGLSAGLLMWLCAAMTVAYFALALAAYRLELECGLRVTKARLITSACIALLVIGLAGCATMLQIVGPLGASSAPRSQAEPVVKKPVEPTVKPDPAQDKLQEERHALQQQLAQLKQHERQMDRRLSEIELALTDKKTPAPASAAPSPEAKAATRRLLWVDVGNVVMYVVPLATVLGAIALVLLGDPRNLIPQIGGKALRTKLRLKTLVQLHTIIEDVRSQRYLDALLKSRELDERALERLDALDLLFFRSYSAIQLSFGGHLAGKEASTGLNYKDLVLLAIRDLESLLDEAPNHLEATYLLALAHCCNADYERGLELFTRVAEEIPGVDLPLEHNRSVCLLNLAEKNLRDGDVAKADKHFSLVTRIKVLADKVPTSWVKVRFQNVRQSLRAGDFERAAEELAAVRQTEHLQDAQHRNAELMCAAFETLIPLRQSNDAEAAQRIEAFLRKYLPAELWEVNDEIADEYLCSPCARHELPLPPDIYRTMFFNLCAARARLLARGGRFPTTAQVDQLVEPLLCGFQFNMRQRDLLAALGGLYYWFYPEKRLRALEWMRAAVDMGAVSRVVRALLEQDRLWELQERETLAWFRSKSARFLRDPTLKRQVRQALVEELGRFQEFKSLLLDLDNLPVLDPVEPTLGQLHDRAKYLNELAAHLLKSTTRKNLEPLDALRSKYSRVIELVEHSTAELAVLEKNLVMEVSKVVLPEVANHGP